MERVTVFCFLASFVVALGADVWHQFRRAPILRLISLGFGVAGVLAQTIYLGVQRPPLAGQAGWMISLSWVLAIFYLFGAIHHSRIAWGVFVLPLVLVLGGLGALYQQTPRGSGWPLEKLFSFQSAHQWLLFMAAVGLCVGFIASLMYLLQSRQLRAKTPPSRAWKLLSLERLEMMNRRAIFLAFPLLTLGMLLGLILMMRSHPSEWTDPRVLASGVLWVTFAVMLYLRLARQARGRRVAVLTIVTFGLLLFCLVLAHPVGTGGGR